MNDPLLDAVTTLLLLFFLHLLYQSLSYTRTVFLPNYFETCTIPVRGKKLGCRPKVFMTQLI